MFDGSDEKKIRFNLASLATMCTRFLSAGKNFEPLTGVKSFNNIRNASVQTEKRCGLYTKVNVRKSYKIIARCLSKLGHKANKAIVCNCLKRYEELWTITHNPKSGNASETTTSAKQIMSRCTGTTRLPEASSLKRAEMSVLAHALRLRQQLGWKTKGTSFCQMIRDANKEKGWTGWLKARTLYSLMNQLSKLGPTEGLV